MAPARTHQAYEPLTRTHLVAHGWRRGHLPQLLQVAPHQQPASLQRKRPVEGARLIQICHTQACRPSRVPRHALDCVKHCPPTHLLIVERKRRICERERHQCEHSAGPAQALMQTRSISVMGRRDRAVAPRQALTQDVAQVKLVRPLRVFQVEAAQRVRSVGGAYQ